MYRLFCALHSPAQAEADQSAAVAAALRAGQVIFSTGMRLCQGVSVSCSLGRLAFAISGRQVPASCSVWPIRQGWRIICDTSGKGTAYSVLCIALHRLRQISLLPSPLHCGLDR